MKDKYHHIGITDPLDRDALAQELERLAPWLHDVELPFGLSTVRSTTARRPEVEEIRLQDLIECVLNPLQERIGSLSGLNMLEVACNCGGLSIEAARRGIETVLGTDIVPHYIAQALLLKRALELSNVDFRVAGIDESPDLGSFDITICCGLLYHLENPVGSIRALAKATKQVLVLDTSVLVGETTPVWYMNIVPPITHDHHHASTGLWRTENVCQFLPSVNAVIQLLTFVGFKNVEVLPVNAHHAAESRRKGEIRTFIANKN